MEVHRYLESLTPKEKQAYEIAKDHLKSLLDITNTNGFIQWQSTQDIKVNTN